MAECSFSHGVSRGDGLPTKGGSAALPPKDPTHKLSPLEQRIQLAVDGDAPDQVAPSLSCRRRPDSAGIQQSRHCIVQLGIVP